MNSSKLGSINVLLVTLLVQSLPLHEPKGSPLVAGNGSFGLGDGNDLLPEFFGEPLEGALFTP